MSLPEDLQWLNVRLRRNHFALWMNLSIIRAGDGEAEVHAPWREEYISNPDIGFTHGGILATLVDTATAYAIATRLGYPPQTVDLRIDYHDKAMQGDLFARGKLLRLGRTIATSEAVIVDANENLVASGRATFLVGSNKPRGSADAS